MTKKLVVIIFSILCLFLITSCEIKIKDDWGGIKIGDSGDDKDPDDKDPNDNHNTGDHVDKDFVTVDSNNNIIKLIINLDTEQYSTDFESDICNAAVTNKKNYQYMVVTITVTNESYKISQDVELYINEELIIDHYTVETDGSKLVYKVNDPNWTPFY